ncbi:GAP family protein [Streptomyces sp. NPDC051907]|uniref:GAP family protein n=1 Tax=Streptomyces sp. NPDC051907 TaxID=3155284 RepID=UPI00341F5CBF
MSSHDWVVMVLDLLLIALAITLYPLPIMAFVLVVSSAGGVWKGLAFIMAWLACLVAVIALVLVLTDGEPPSPRSPPGVAGLAAKLVFGLLLVGYGLHRHRLMRARAAQRANTAQAPGRQDDAPTQDPRRQDGAPTQDPRRSDGAPPRGRTSKMTASLDDRSAWAAAGLAVLLQPWGMVGAAAATVVEANTSHLASFLALFGFCILASASLIAAELHLVLAPEAAQARLMRLRAWLEDHQQQAIVILCLVLGLWLTGKSIYQLTS